MIPFVNIHTHHQKSQQNVIELLNCDITKYNSEEVLPKNFTLGFHPWHVTKQNYTPLLAKLYSAILANKPHAIGEAGLDKRCKSDWELQLEIFTQQITWAYDFKLPLIIHNVKAHNDCATLLRYIAGEQAVIMHGFNNNWNVAQQFLNIGCKLSFGAALLMNDSNAASILPKLNFNQFYLETDDDSGAIEEVYSQAANILACSVDKLKEEMNQNFNKDFIK